MRLQGGALCVDQHQFVAIDRQINFWANVATIGNRGDKLTPTLFLEVYIISDTSVNIFYYVTT